jgi:hypothetical protein
MSRKGAAATIGAKAKTAAKRHATKSRLIRFHTQFKQTGFLGLIWFDQFYWL